MVHTTSTLNDPRSRSRSRSSSHGGDLNSRRQPPPLQTSLRRSPRLHPQKDMPRTPVRRSARFASQINEKETDETKSPSVKMMETGRVLRSSVRGINPIKKNSVGKHQPRCLKKCHSELRRRSPRFSGISAKGTDKEYCPRNDAMRSDRVLRSRVVTKATVPVKKHANGDFVVRRSLRIAKENSVGLNTKTETSKHQKVNKLENEETTAGTKSIRSTNAYPEVSTPEDEKARKQSKHEIHSNKDEEIDEDEVQTISHVDGWTKEQDEALRRAYFTAMPSPNFWKMVSKMIPGKSAKECFDRVHSDHATPIHQPRSRVKRPNISPIGSLTLLNDKSIEHILPNSKLPKTNRHNTLVARRTARHLLRKHCLLDQNKEADFFSVFETSPMSFTIDIPEIETPGTSESKLSSPGLLQRCNKRSTSEHNKMLSRLRTENQLKTESPEVLKQIKNIALHERYIDHLRCRESKRRASSKTVGTVTDSHCQNGSSKACMLKAAKTALMCEAKDVINQFQNKQANVFDNDDELDLRSGSDDNDDE